MSLTDNASCVDGGAIERMKAMDLALQQERIRDLTEYLRRIKIIIAGQSRFLDDRRVREEFDPKQWMSLVEKVADGAYPDCWDIVPKP